ncbi:Aspartate--ammonia ligase [Mycoplasmopsis synoviae]|nr:Aspartate--ammonia ligase [Mycoplasmopsis synoviae]AQU47813.1 Aspartate--ammonia ligase [Mycoplasmopsis synoviae]
MEKIAFFIKSMYKTKLDVKTTQFAIHDLKIEFAKNLAKSLNLIRVSAPLFVEKQSQVNDGLNGEKLVEFTPKNTDKVHEIIHSLAKWKRIALKKYNFDLYQGLYTDMNAIRREETLDYKHSYYVDQWDWELVINYQDRNLTFLKKTVNKIYNAIKKTQTFINKKYNLEDKLPQKVFFISSGELYKLYPNLDASKREDEIAKIHRAVFVYKVGYNLKDQKPQSAGVFDYDDWNLNGDLIFYDHVNDKSLEVSSMGIRVDEESLLKQKAI